MIPQPLGRPERVLDLGTDAGLELLQPVGQFARQADLV